MAQKQLDALPQSVAVEEDDILLLRKTLSNTDEKLRLDVLRPDLLQENLTSIATLGTAENKALYTTGTNEWAETDVGDGGRSLLAMPTVTQDGRSLLTQSTEDQRTSLGVDGLTGRNAIINGNFDIWQQGTSFSGAGYTADRWSVGIGGTGEVVSTSQGDFALGQTDVPGNPRHYLRLDVSDGGTGTSAYIETRQRIEGVDALAGETVALTFWAKADAARDVRTRVVQNFGTGGTPSAFVIKDADIVALTTAWQKFTVIIAIPSISGKSLGTDGNDFLQITFRVSDGSDTIGIQTGVFDFAQVQLEPGSIATPFERRPIGTELALCQRYATFLERGGASGFCLSNADRVSFSVLLGVTLRTTPSVVLTTGSVSVFTVEGKIAADPANASFISGSGRSYRLNIDGFPGLTNGRVAILDDVTSSIFLDAEL